MKRHGSHWSGFTLLELLVALSITLVVVVLLLAVTRGALGLWSMTTGRLRTHAQAQAILDRVQLDLESACLVGDGGVCFAATVLDETSLSGWWEDGLRAKPAGESLRVEPQVAEDCRFGIAGVWLRFFTATSGDDGAADVRAVGYQLVRRELAPGVREWGYLLHRAEVSAANTFAAGYDLDLDTGGYRARSATPGNAGNLIRPPLSSVIGDHVVDFGIRVYRIKDYTLEQVFPLVGRGEYLARQADGDLPAVVEVVVRILDDSGVRRLAAYEAGHAADSGADAWWRIVEEHSKVVVRRVVLPGRGQ